MESVLKLIYKHSETQVEVIGSIITNKSLSVEDALEILGLDMDELAIEKGWDGYDYNALDTTLL